MENKKNNTEDSNFDVVMLFDNFIKTGKLEKEKEVVPGMTIKLKPLNTSELIAAEAIMSYSSAPADIVAKVRGASILSQAMISINGDIMASDNIDSEALRQRRIVLYQQILKLPPIVIQRMYEFYLEVVEEQKNKYENIEDTVRDIENF